MNRRRPALGRGLGALLPTHDVEDDASSGEPYGDASSAERGARAPHGPSDRGLRTLPIEALVRNPAQPRQDFDETRLEELAQSIRANGIIQPIVVTPSGRGDGTYVILAGERRWRAAQLAGKHDVDVVIRDTPEEQRLELALVENLQRADLNPIEEALAFNQLIDLRGYSQDELGERVGKDRSTISNALRLLRLPEKVQSMVRDGTLSMGHARALLGLRESVDVVPVAREIAQKGWSVRVTEQAVRKRNSQPKNEPAPASTATDEERRRTIIVAELEGRLRRRLGVQARLKTSARAKGAGAIEIPYASLEELDRVLRILLDAASDHPT